MSLSAEESKALEKIVEQVGGTIQNAIFAFGVLYGTQGGTLTASFNAFQGSPLTFPFSAAQLRANLEEIATIGEGGVKVTGAIGGPFRIEMQGGNAGQEVEPILFNGLMLNPSQEIETEVEQEGDSTDYFAKAVSYYNDHADKASQKLRLLYAKSDLIQFRIGKKSDAVDTRTGTANVLERKESQGVGNLERMLTRVAGEIDQEEKSLTAGSQATFGGVMRLGQNPHSRPIPLRRPGGGYLRGR